MRRAKTKLGLVRGRFDALRLAEGPLIPTFSIARRDGRKRPGGARGEKETAVRPGHVRNKSSES
jgi:hypothetical protein